MVCIADRLAAVADATERYRRQPRRASLPTVLAYMAMAYVVMASLPPVVSANATVCVPASRHVELPRRAARVGSARPCLGWGTAYVVMAYVVMVYVAMAYVVMARPCWAGARHGGRRRRDREACRGAIFIDDQQCVQVCRGAQGGHLRDLQRLPGAVPMPQALTTQKKIKQPPKTLSIDSRGFTNSINIYSCRATRGAGGLFLRQLTKWRPREKKTEKK